MPDIVRIRDLHKAYPGGTEALAGVTLDIRDGEILALLGPNGAGKTTLISIVCGLTRLTSGSVTVDGHDIRRDYRAARRMIGLVPQEITLEPFETVLDTVRLTRGLYGRAPDEAHLRDVLTRLSLWDRRDAKTMELSGGMKRRVLIAKALSHAPRVLFLDEPTAGVDVTLRRGMWETVRELRASGVTVILTTHYIEEAEAIADRIGVIDRGALRLVEETGALMRRMGQKRMRIDLTEPVAEVPAALVPYGLERTEDGRALIYTYDRHAERTGITRLLSDLSASGLVLDDVTTHQSSLEDIFMGLVGAKS